MDMPVAPDTQPADNRSDPLADQNAAKTAAEYLASITKDWERLKAQKSRATGGIEGRVLLNLCMGAGEHYTVYANRQILAQPLDPNKLSLVFNLIDTRVNKLIGRLCSIGGKYKANPDRRDPKAFAEAEIVDRMDKAVDQKVDQPSRTREILFWLCYGGTAFVYTPWIKNISIEPMPQYGDPTPENPQGELLYNDLAAPPSPDGAPTLLPASAMQQLVAQGRPKESFEIYEDVQEVGDVGCLIYGPLQVFLDQGVRSVEDLAPDQAIYVAQIKTQGWIEENYPGSTEDLDGDDTMQIITTQFQQMDGATVAGTSLKDMIPLVQGTRAEDDPDMNVVIERYQPASKQYPRGRQTCFVPNKKVLYDGDNPYEEVPIVDFHFKPVTTTFWTKDYVTDLIAAQRFINKRMSQMGEQSNASIYDKILLGPGLSEKDIPADWPGMVKNGVNEQGVAMVQRLGGPELPNWFMSSIDLSTKMFNDIAGGTDLFQEHQFPGQLRGPSAVPMLQEIIDTEWGPFYEHFGERMARVKQMRLNRVKQFYPATRTMHYMDRTQRDEVFEFHTDKILKSGTNFNITVERGSLIPEMRALREARVRERLASPLSILYMDERTGRLDKSKIASDLQFGDTGRESREAQYRKLGGEVVGRLWRAEPVPPVQPFYHHAVMMDELEAAMATTEYFSASQQIQQLFIGRWSEHNQFLQQIAQMQQQSMMSMQTHQAVAQATQQAAATAAAETVKESSDQLRAQVQGASQVPAILQHAFQGIKA